MSIKLTNMVPGPKYSGVLLDDESHKKLLSHYKSEIPDSWNRYAHHLTIDPFGLVPAEIIGTPVELKITHFGKSNKAIAVKCIGYKGKTNNKFPHVTIAVNIIGGGKPKDSNDIQEWKDESGGLVLKGSIQNL
jgi:hypothetical protein